MMTSADPHNRSAVPFMYAVLSTSTAGSERTSLRWREKLLVPGNATVIFHTLNPPPSERLQLAKGRKDWETRNEPWLCQRNRRDVPRAPATSRDFSFSRSAITSEERRREERDFLYAYRKAWLSRRFVLRANFRFRIDLHNRNKYRISKILSETIFRSILPRSTEIL